MGDPPTPGHSIDRVDNDGGYWCGRADCSDCGPAVRPCNCRWATRSQQQRNKRLTVRIETDRGTESVVDARERCGVSPRLFRLRRARGWSVEVAATAPVRPYARTKQRGDHAQQHRTDARHDSLSRLHGEDVRPPAAEGQSGPR